MLQSILHLKKKKVNKANSLLIQDLSEIFPVHQHIELQL